MGTVADNYFFTQGWGMLEKAYVFKNISSSWATVLEHNHNPFIIMCRQCIDSSQINGGRIGRTWLRIF